MSEGPSIGSEQSTVLARAVERLLRPLVRLMLEKQLEFPFVANLLKSLYVDVAERDVALPGRKPTDSRISLLTGIHRREVKRIRAENRVQVGPPSLVTTGALLVSRWIGDAAFLDDEGKPRPLPRRTPAPEASFESLVTAVTADLPPRSILDEWLRLGIVEQQEDGLLRLVSDSFGAEQGFEEKSHFFGRNLRDHIAAGAHNLLGGQPTFLDRSIYYDRLSRESAAQLAEIAREDGAEFLRKMNRLALELQREDEIKDRTTYRITVGSYFYAVDQVEESGESVDEAGAADDE